MNVTILGAGAYGLALSKMFVKNKCKVTIWTAVESEYKMIKRYNCNRLALPGYTLDKSVTITMDMKEALDNAKLIVVAIPIKFLRNTLMEVKKYYKRAHICITSKGIEQNSCMFSYDIVKKILKTNKIGIISGGTFAVDMIQDMPMGLSVASKNKQTNAIIKKCLENDLLRVEITSDVFGTQFWGSIKNVMAIGCGIMDGMKYPDSSKSLFFTKCFKDITDLVYEFGGNKSTATTYAGIGDLYLTCNSVKSRNYTFGKMIGEKINKNYLAEYVETTTVEGYYTLKSFYKLIHKKKRKTKIIDILYSIVYNNGDLKLLDDFLKK